MNKLSKAHLCLVLHFLSTLDDDLQTVATMNC